MNLVRVALVAALALAAVLLLARATTRPGPATTLARAAADPAAAADPTHPATLRDTLGALDRARAAGYADPATADPDTWATRRCSCHAEDVRRLRALAARGHALRGQRTTVLGVRVVRAGPGFADLAVTDATTAYTTVDARGRPVARWPGSGRREWRITLVRVAGRWLLGTVARAP